MARRTPRWYPTPHDPPHLQIVPDVARLAVTISSYPALAIFHSIIEGSSISVVVSPYAAQTPAQTYSSAWPD